jgi:hypothetical protein
VFVNAILINMLKDLTERISEVSQSGVVSQSSWFGKKGTTGEKFWKSLETNLTKFVAGEEAVDEPQRQGSGKSSLDIQDPRFTRIASETSLNRMASLPNLRAQSNTPTFDRFPPELSRSAAHSRYSTITSESRYNPSARMDQSTLYDAQEYDGISMGTGEDASLKSPRPSIGGYSPHLPPPQIHHQPEPEIAAEPLPTEEKEAPRQRTETEQSNTSSTSKDDGKGNSYSKWFLIH